MCVQHAFSRNQSLHNPELSDYNISPACWPMSFLPLEFGPKSRELRQSFLCAYIRTLKAWVLLVGGHVLSGWWRNKGSWSVVRRKKIYRVGSREEPSFYRGSDPWILLFKNQGPEHSCPWVPWYTKCLCGDISCWNFTWFLFF